MIINLKSNNELSGLYIIYEGSVNIETENEAGLSHIIEHCHAQSFKHLHNEFELYGINWNASTSQSEIIFHFTGLEENLKKYRKDIVESLNKFTISKDDFINEKKIIIEEYKDAFNSQISSHFLNLDRKLFGNYNAIGKLSTLEKLSYLDCINFYEKQFMDISKIINVSKDTEFGIDINLKTPKHDKVYNYMEDNDYELELGGNSYGDKSSLICLSPFIDEDFQYIHFINKMLSSGLNSPMYQEIREKRQLVYSIGCGMRDLNGRGLNCISTMTSNDNISKVIETLKEIFNNVDKHLTKDRFDVVKNSISINLKKQHIYRHVNVDRWIASDGFAITQEFIDGVDLNRCKEVFGKYYNFDKWYISVDKEEFK